MKPWKTQILLRQLQIQINRFSHSLHPGVHLNAVGSFKPEMQELPSETMLIANKIVVESTEAAMEETGDLKSTIRRRYHY